jgi:arsenical pump membrane protein
MALPWLLVLAVEWLVFRRFFAVDLERPRRAEESTSAGVESMQPSWFAVAVLGLTLIGFALSSPVHVAPVWIAVAGATLISVPALVRRTTTPLSVVRAAGPAFLIFVLGLGVIVATASHNGLGSAVSAVLPSGSSLPDLLAIAGLSAVLANLVNNLPATLILVPVAATGGAVPVLAVLIGVNVGPNLTYVGSLATLLWRRVLRAEDTDVDLGEFTRLGALTVPAALVVCTVGLWFSAQGLT